jgi:hypothetical protein
MGQKNVAVVAIELRRDQFLSTALAKRLPSASLALITNKLVGVFSNKVSAVAGLGDASSRTRRSNNAQSATTL